VVVMLSYVCCCVKVIDHVVFVSHVFYIVQLQSAGCYCLHGSEVFVFLCTLDNSRNAKLSLIKFCTNMYLDNRTNAIEFQGKRSRSQDRIIEFFTIARQGKKACRHDKTQTAALGLITFCMNMYLDNL